MLVWRSETGATTNRVVLPPLIPPFRFSIVEGSTRAETLYRSAFPTERSYRYLKRLKLKTIISLVPRSMMGRSGLPAFCKAQGINHVSFPAAGTQKPLDASEDDPDGPAPTHSLCAEVLTLCIDRERLPLLIHDHNGAHVCGLIVALLRKLQHIATDSHSEEFVRFTKYHVLEDDDRNFIQRFYSAVTLPASLPSWLWGGERPTKHPTLPLFAAAVSVGLSPEDAEAEQEDFAQPQMISERELGPLQARNQHRRSLVRAHSSGQSAEVLSMLAGEESTSLASQMGGEEEDVRGMSVEDPSSIMRRRAST